MSELTECLIDSLTRCCSASSPGIALVSSEPRDDDVSPGVWPRAVALRSYIAAERDGSLSVWTSPDSLSVAHSVWTPQGGWLWSAAPG